MELGIRPNIDQFKENNAVQMQQVQQGSGSAKTSEQKELQQIQKQSIENEKATSEASEVKNDAVNNSNFEVLISNTNFGYNGSSQDFFVKVARGNVENQYPTEDMMRVKAEMMALNKESVE